MNKTKRFLGLVCLALAIVSVPGVSSVRAQSYGGYDNPYFQADFVQELSDWSSSIINPALLYRVNQFHLDFGLYRWGLGSQALGFQDGSFLVPIRRNETIGLTWIGAGADITPSTVGAGGPQTGSGTLSYRDNWFIGTYAVRLPPLPWLMIGCNLKYRLQRQFDKGTDINSVPGVDVGIYINPLDHYRFGDLGLSINLQDIVPATLAWDDSGQTSDQPATTRLRLGVRYALFNDKLVMDCEAVLDNLFIGLVDAVGLLSASDTGGSNPKVIAPRVSFHLRYQFIPQLWIKVGWNNNNVPYLGLSANLIVPLPEMINYVTVDCNVGYGALGSSDERGFTLMAKGAIDFGPTREQRESRRLYDRLILEPMNAYDEAMRLYMAGKYWDAGFAFGKVMALFPNFSLNDKVSFYLSDCYYRLQLNSISREVCKEALEEYTTSEQRAKYLYGLERLDYREGRPDDALKNHAFIINLYPDSDIKPEADYLAAQIQFERRNYSAAEQLLKGIKQGTTVYLYAQYTLSIISIEGNKVQDGIRSLTNIVSDTTLEASEALLQDAANLKLGHVYFEQGNQLRQAVEAYSRIPVGSPFGDEAMLATAWAWIKVNKPDIARETIDRLILAYGESAFLPEAYLVKGYSLMLLKRYREAVASLEKCLELCKGKFITDEEVANHKRVLDRVTQDFVPTEQEIKKNAMRKPTDKLLEDRPALKSEFDKYYKGSDDFFRFTLLAKTHGKFFKRKDQLIEDAEYALAKATSMMKATKEVQEIQKTKDKTGDIDNEIQKLKDKLKGLNK
jgi:tetratricopeptide (TPR) repeat protein